jgi:hypothetical protein
MAQVTEIELIAGNVAGTQEQFAEVSFKAIFTETEIRVGIPFRVYIDLYERDGQRDIIVQSPVWEGDPRIARPSSPTPGAPLAPSGTGLVKFAMSNNPSDLDGYVGSLFDDEAPLVSPPAAGSGESTRALTYHRQWDFGPQDRGNEELYVVVWLRPEIHEAWAESAGVTGEFGRPGRGH